MIRFPYERQEKPESIPQEPDPVEGADEETYAAEGRLSGTERRDAEGCYITHTSLRQQDPACGGKKMEFLAWLYRDLIAVYTDQCRAYINGKGSFGSDKESNADEVSYMADYGFDEYNRITEVHYEPVLIRHGEWTAERSKGGNRIRMDSPDPSA